MRERPEISAIIITLNEEKKLQQCLDSLAWVDEIIVVDSGSTDTTREIARESGAKVLEKKWEGYGQQKNYAMSQSAHDWVLSIDADEVVSPELRNSIEQFLQNANAESPRILGAEFARKTWYLGRWILHGGWYPNFSTRLAWRKAAKWTEPAVHETLQIMGPVTRLSGDLLHYSFDSVADQVQTNIRFAHLGTLVAKQRGETATWLKILFKPLGKFLETYLWKRGFLDGFPGFVISINAAHSIFMKYVGLRLETNSRH